LPPDLPDRIPERQEGARRFFFIILKNSFVFLHKAGNRTKGGGEISLQSVCPWRDFNGFHTWNKPNWDHLVLKMRHQLPELSATTLVVWNNLDLCFITNAVP
jgi:hypothetical protein